jgi:hypothetical protein
MATVPSWLTRSAALQLGKALFWDMNVRDGEACATVTHAGADRRVRNQLDTGVRHEKAPTGTTFEKTASGAAGGPNYTSNPAISAVSAGETDRQEIQGAFQHRRCSVVFRGLLPANCKP